ncbi:hypothetical protein PIB30_086345, partial [Stylosanthes scabra]|nr:hypothetical protein [Stylosanthes scabra]
SNFFWELFSFANELKEGCRETIEEVAISTKLSLSPWVTQKSSGLIERNTKGAEGDQVAEVITGDEILKGGNSSVGEVGELSDADHIVEAYAARERGASCGCHHRAEKWCWWSPL